MDGSGGMAGRPDRGPGLGGLPAPAVSVCEDTPLAMGGSNRFRWRYAYAVSADAAATGEPGQDYLTFRSGDGWFAFAICDGVGQSFLGEVAARYLGDDLLQWLSSSLPETFEESEIVGALSGHLSDITAGASELVDGYQLRDDLVPALKKVLERKRQAGSESTFVAVRVDLPCGRFPEGRAAIAWMGDSRVRAWGPGGELSAGWRDSFATGHRWSTRTGAVGGEPNVRVFRTRNVGAPLLTALAAYTDGLDVLSEMPELPKDEGMDNLVRAAASRPTSDDLSFLELTILDAAGGGKVRREPRSVSAKRGPFEREHPLESDRTGPPFESIGGRGYEAAARVGPEAEGVEAAAGSVRLLLLEAVLATCCLGLLAIGDWLMLAGRFPLP